MIATVGIKGLMELMEDYMRGGVEELGVFVVPRLRLAPG